MGTARFADRNDAGRQLAEVLAERGIGADIVLAIPRGGLPLGRAVADALGAPLDVVVARKIGAPDNPEFALGAVTPEGQAWYNESVLERRDIGEEYVERTRETEAANAREKADRYREGDRLPDLAGKRVVIVDDGVATGATARACARQVTAAGAERVVLAIPVGSPRTVEELASEVDEVVCLATPERFRAVGQFYDRFDQVSDEAAMAYLERD